MSGKVFFYLLICFSISITELYGQKPVKVEDKTFILERIKTIPNDTLAGVQTLEEIKRQLISKGYLSYQFENSEDTFRILPGPRFTWAKLEVEGEDKIKKKLPDPTNYLVFSAFLESWVAALQNEGYPFASVQMKNIQISEDNEISASLIRSKGPLIKMDTLLISGDSSVILPYRLNHLLLLKPGSTFHGGKILNVADKLEALPYLQLIGNPELSFQNEEARIYLPLQARRASSLDAFLGLLPAGSPGEAPIWTGQVDIQLQNLLKRGHHTGILWQRTRPESQRLDTYLELNHPFGMDFSWHSQFKLLKEDSTFLNLLFENELLFPFRNHAFWEISFLRHSSRTLSALSQDSPFAGFNTNWYGLAYSWQKGSSINLQRAYQRAFVRVEAGRKVYEEENEDKQILQTRLRISWQWNKPLKGKWGYFQDFSAQAFFASRLFLNELERIGGLKTLRGFNELEFFASNYLLGRNELRFFFENNSYFFAVADAMLLNNQLLDAGLPAWQLPIGLGLGFSLRTNSGDFQFILASGNELMQAQNFSPIKVHFGYFTRF